MDCRRQPVGRAPGMDESPIVRIDDWDGGTPPVGRAPGMVRVNPDRDAHPTVKQGSFFISGSQWSVSNLVGSTKWQSASIGVSVISLALTSVCVLMSVGHQIDTVLASQSPHGAVLLHCSQSLLPLIDHGRIRAVRGGNPGLIITEFHTLNKGVIW